MLCFPWSHEHPSSCCASDADSRLPILESPVKSIFVFSDPPTPHSPLTRVRPPPPCSSHPHTPPCTPLSPFPPLCMARACGVWWRADVCVPLCVSCEQSGQTPLVHACYNGHRDVALRLLRLGADPAIQNNDVSPPPAPLRHQRCVCGVRGVLGHVCGGRVSGRVLRGTEDLGTEFRRPTCPKSLFQICYHYFRPD